jgi:hypothetical protein
MLNALPMPQTNKPLYSCDGPCKRHFGSIHLTVCECGKVFCPDCYVQHLAQSQWCLGQFEREDY